MKRSSRLTTPSSKSSFRAVPIYQKKIYKERLRFHHRADTVYAHLFLVLVDMSEIEMAVSVPHSNFDLNQKRKPYKNAHTKKGKKQQIAYSLSNLAGGSLPSPKTDLGDGSTGVERDVVVKRHGADSDERGMREEMESVDEDSPTLFAFL